MNENSSEILQTFSKRAQDFLSTPRHALAKTERELANKLWFWDFSLEKIQQNNFKSDKILTLNYFNNSASVLDTLFLETLSRMVIGRDIEFLQRLSFRELENFLRDENHLPVFTNSGAVSPEESFKVVKNSLLAALLIKEIEKKEGTLDQLKGWSQLTLVEKNQRVRTFIEILNSLISQVKPLELALAEAGEIAIVMNDFPFGCDVLELLIHESIGNAKEISSLKVVAVQ